MFKCEQYMHEGYQDMRRMPFLRINFHFLKAGFILILKIKNQLYGMEFQ